MKILNADQIRELDQYTIKNEPIASIDLMERASERFTIWLLNEILNKQKSFSDILIFAGMGNNGGDGLAIARLLQRKGYIPKTYIVKFTKSGSVDFNINLKRLGKEVPVAEIQTEVDIPLIPDNSLVIDAIFGSGLSRKISGIAAEVIERINLGNNTVVSVDIPSGLYSNQINIDENKVNADRVLSFQFPKAAFLMQENEQYVKAWSTTEIGLSQEGIDKTHTNKFFTEITEIKRWLKPRGKFSHKGTYGHLLVMAGSKGKIGAAQLTLKAALKSGVGLLTAFVPTCAYEIIQLAVPEAMCIIDKHDEALISLPDISNFKTIAIGPGMGTSSETIKMFEALIAKLNKPTVFDADAINILAKNKSLLSVLPQNSILTPHPKEFERLVGKSEDTPEQWRRLADFCKKYKVITVLKGAYSAVGDTEGNIYFNSTGNPGMATGGSGDVLTGIIAGLLVSGYTPLQAARLGVYIHGLSGDIAASEIGQTSLCAGDIVNFLGKAFITLQM